MMKKILKLTTLLMTLGATLIFSSGAYAFPGTRGPNTPGYITAPGVTPDTDNTIGGHLMRMTDPDGGGPLPPTMDMNGMLMQHHFAHSGVDGANPFPVNPTPVSTRTGNPGINVTAGATNPTGQVSIEMANFAGGGALDQGLMRVEILAFNDASDAFGSVASVTANAGSPGTFNPVGSFNQADLSFNGMLWDYSYFDFALTGESDWQQLVLDTNGANIGQIFVWTVATPIPAAVWLFGTGLVGLLSISRRKSFGEVATI